MLVLNQNDLIGLLPPSALIEAVEAALRADSAGGVVAPARLHLHWDDHTLLAMPAANKTAAAVKVVSVVPGNAARNLPVTTGAMILNDGTTGVPLALLNAAALTAQRTGAVGAVGVKYLTPSDTRSAGIVGCGVQATWQAIFACAVRPISHLFVYSRSMSGFERFSLMVSKHVPNVRIVACRDVRELLERVTLVITATTSAEPVLPDEPELLERKHFISVGSFRPTMQELPNSVYRLAGQLAVDSEHALHEVGDVINPLQAGLLREENVFSIGECVMGKRAVDVDRNTAYKSVGAAMYDLFVAEAFYRAAKSRGVGVEVAL
jgi:ornithine cyclodeaminase/alanine dehydrogenase-like protein (mu-crystallin family)